MRINHLALAALAFGSLTFGQNSNSNGDNGSCQGLPTAAQLTVLLKAAPGGPTHTPDAGGLFHGDRMWVAVVNRDGKICAYATNQSDNSQVWPGSQAIAKSKAYTAN